MTTTILWNCDEPIRDVAPKIEIPQWITDQNITPVDVASILEGGCASGAYMPAVTYADAIRTMSEHGDDVLKYLQDTLGALPTPRDDESWSGMACHYLSAAVEVWASQAEEALETALCVEDDETEA